MTKPADHAKYVAARRAVEFVEDGMRVGLGTGSTAAFMVQALGELVREEGLRLRAVATSAQTARLAAEVGIKVEELEALRWLDVTIDGADEVDGNLNMIKGGGGALLREKIVATASDQVVIIADASKAVGTLGRHALPVEIVPFGWTITRGLIEEILLSLDTDRRTIKLRQQDGQPFLTDQGNYILDLDLGRVGSPSQMAMVLNQVPGVVENGLFLDMCDTLVLGHADGTAELRDLSSGRISHERVDMQDTENLFGDIADG